MALSLELLRSYKDQEISMLKRSEKQAASGDFKDSSAIQSEWEGASALNLLVLNIDSFVKQ